MEISKADWKLFQQKLPDWQERFMEKLNREYAALLTSPGNASDHFWELDKRIKNDRHHPGVILELSKSHMMWDILTLIRRHVITLEDLEGFSEELITEIRAKL